MTMANAVSQKQVLEGDYSADNYVKSASFVFSDEYTGPILSWLNANPGDRIIDLGCGSGELTVKIQNAVGAKGFVLGVDYNEDMVCRSVASRRCRDKHILHRC
jgi:ubiquinone/menaquinone biosynthesis C-methylase UbiE